MERFILRRGAVAKVLGIEIKLMLLEYFRSENSSYFTIQLLVLLSISIWGYMHMWLFTNAIDIASRIHGRIRIWVCCYAPDFRTGTFIAAIRRCREVFSRWECGFHWKLCYCWLEGLRRRRVAVIMQGQGIRAHLFVYIYYHMRCMGSWFNVLLMISANVFLFF